MFGRRNYLEELVNGYKNIANELGRIFNDMHFLKDRTKEISENIGNTERLTKENEILIELLSKKYEHGIVIVYNEASPRELLLIEDGKKIDLESKNEVNFFWTSGEFPHLSIEN